MERDLDLIREILLIVEADDLSQEKTFYVDDFIDPQQYPNEIDDFSSTQTRTPYIQEFCRISQHFELLADSGFIELSEYPTFYETNCKNYQLIRITQAGYDYLNSVRDTSYWEEFKIKYGNTIKSFTLSTLSQLLQSYMLNKMGI